MYSLKAQVAVQNGVVAVVDAAKDDKGEIGSQLIIMALLVAVAAAAVAAFDTPLRTLVSNIAGGLGTTGGGDGG